MADTGMPKAGDDIADKYRIEQLIGVGGMGAVFSARHLITGKRVALKWMLPELAKDLDAVHRFLREAHAAGRISHPNVVDVYDVGKHGESYFLVMEFLQGEPLTSALARRDMTAPEVLSLLLPAMRGVAAAHRRGVVHRDLKPDNIFLAYEEDGVRRDAKVLDFGISKVASEGQQPTDLRLTKTGAVVGTPFYMAPEQIRGSHELDQRADVYAFGVILYEALTGRVPFEAESYGALVLEVATGTPRKPHELVPTLPVELSLIVLRAMARDLNERFGAMESLIAALEPFTQPNALRVTAQRSAQTPDATDALEASRIHTMSVSAWSAQQPHVSTRSHLTSTPFASEVRELDGMQPQAHRSALWIATVVLGVAAAAFGLSAWIWTREPIGVAGPTGVTQVQGALDDGAATLQPPTSGADARGALDDSVPPTSPLTADADLEGEPVRGSASLPATPSTTESMRGVRGGARVDSARANRFESSSRSSSRRGSSRHRNRENVAPVSSPRRAGSEGDQGDLPEPENDAQILRPDVTPKQTHRARSGSLNVNEF